jgi:phage repressor protein C with HTH and peptisase S24 domain
MKPKKDRGALVSGYTKEVGTRIGDVINMVGGNVAAGKIAGVSDEQVGRWKNGRSKPNFFGLAALAEKAGVSLDWINTGKEPETHVTSGVVDDAPLDEQLLEECIKFVREIEEERQIILANDNFAKAVSGCYGYVMECREKEEKADMKAMKHALKMAM